MFGIPPPPGWYPDPGGAGVDRWWDGQHWSQDLRPAPSVPTTVPVWDPPAGPDLAGRTDRGPGSGDPPVIPARAAWWALVGLLVGEVLGGLIGGIDVVVTGSSATGAVPTLVGELGLWTGMLGSCVFVSRRYGTGSLRRDYTLGFRPIDLAYGLGAGIAGLILADLVASLFIGSRLSGTNTQILTGEKGDGAGFVIVTLIAALGAPLFEELFFRGLLRTALSARLGPTGAIWAQAGLFGLAHYEPGTGLGNVSVILAIASLGVLLGYTAKITGRLGAGMVAHSVFNAIAAIAVLVS